MKKATQDKEIQKKDHGKTNEKDLKNMAAAVAATPGKRDNSHMSPPDKNLQTKVTVLSPKFKEMFLSSMRKEINRHNDGYDTDDDVPLSLLRGKGDGGKGNENSTISLNDSIVITDDISQGTRQNEELKGAVDTVDDPTEGVTDRDDTSTAVQDQSKQVRGAIEQVRHDPDPDIDPAKEVNSEQLTAADTANGGTEIVITKLLESIESINKKLEKLEVVEKEVKNMNDHMLKKEDVERIIQGQLIAVKTSLVSQDLQIKKQQIQIENMDKRIGKRIQAIETEIGRQDERETGVTQKDAEKMIENAQDQMRKEIGALKTNEAHTGESGSKTNRNIIIHGMSEDRKVGDITKVQDVAFDIGLSLHRWDVDNTVRLGAYEKGKKRPLKVGLVSETTKVDFLKNKRKLKTSELYNDIQVVPDEEKEIRKAKAILRQAAYLAKQRGDRVWQRHDLIWVNGVKYTVETVDKIPDDLRFKNRGKDNDWSDRKNVETQESATEKENEDEGMDVTEPQDIGSQNFQNKNWDQACRAANTTPDELEMDGAMHLTKRGLAFFMGKTYLSNFHLVEMKFNGRIFPSAEHIYQYEKASVCRDPGRMERIYRAKTPKEAKDIGGEVKTTPLWDKLKDDRMREILDAKFSQNADIRKKLMDTWGLYLIEGSTDGYWGAGKRLYTKDLMEGRWYGQNKLGEFLVELRTDLRRRGY